MSLRATYRIPGINHLFLIVDSLNRSIERPRPSKRMEYFESILRSKDSRSQKEAHRSELKVSLISDEDFLEVMEIYTKENQEFCPQSLSCPEALTLLSVNSKQNLSSESNESFKCPGFISEEDIIEVFI